MGERDAESGTAAGAGAGAGSAGSEGGAASARRAAAQRGQEARAMATPDGGVGFGRRSAAAATAAMAGQGAQMALTLGSVVVLARLLTPADFGVVAMAMTVISFTGVIRDLGLPTSTVFKKRLTDHQVSTLFWINAGFGVLLAGLVVATGPAVAWAYDEPRVFGVLALLSTSLVFNGLGAQHEALLRRTMEFGSQARAATWGTAAGVVATVGLAAAGAGYWSLAAQQPVEAAVRSGLVYRAAGWRPGRPRHGTGLWGMLGFAGNVTAYRAVTHVGKHLDRVLLSASAGPGAVGLYSLADRWASLPGTVIYGRLGSVATSAFTRLQDQPARLREYFRRAMLLLWTVMLPMLAGIGLEAAGILRVLAGPQWREAVVLLEVLAWAAVALAVSQPTKWMYLAEGRTAGQLAWGTVAAAVTAAGVGAGVAWGVRGVAVGFAGATVLLTPLTLWVWLRGSVVGWSEVAGALVRPGLATLAMAGAWWALPGYVGAWGEGTSAAGAWARLGWSVPTLAGVYVVVWLVLPGGGRAARELVATVGAMRGGGNRRKQTTEKRG